MRMASHLDSIDNHVVRLNHFLTNELILVFATNVRTVYVYTMYVLCTYGLGYPLCSILVSPPVTLCLPAP